MKGVITFGIVAIFAHTTLANECGKMSNSFKEKLPSNDEIRIGSGSRRRFRRVVGGVHVSDSALPWMVSLHTSFKNRLICGGSLLSDRVVLTAAHCLYDKTHDYRNRLNHLKIRIGSTTVSHPAPHMTIVDHYIPNNYNRYTYSNDYALLLLENSVPFSDSVSPICLPQVKKEYRRYRSRYFAYATKGVAAGWGDTRPWDSSHPRQDQRTSPALNAVKLQIADFSGCKEKLRLMGTKLNPNIMFCAKGVQPSAAAASNGEIPDICQGDSGGPFVSRVKYNDGERAVATGVISWGEGCGTARSAHFFTKITGWVAMRIRIRMRNWQRH